MARLQGGLLPQGSERVQCCHIEGSAPDQPHIGDDGNKVCRPQRDDLPVGDLARQRNGDLLHNSPGMDIGATAL